MPVLLPILGDLLFALLCLALAASIFTFGKFLGQLTQAVPIVGHYLSEYIEGWSSTAVHWLVDATHAAYGRMGALLIDGAWIITAPLRLLIDVLNHHANQFSFLAHTTIPDATNAANQYTDDRANALIVTESADVSRLDRNLASASSTLQGDISNLRSYVDNTVAPDLRTYSDHQLGRVEGELVSDINALQSDTNAELDKVWSSVSALNNAAFSTLPASIEAVAANDQAAVQASTEQAQAHLTAAANALQAEINTIAAEISAQQVAIGDAESAIALLDTESATFQNDLADQLAKITAAQASIDSLTSQLDTVSGNLHDVTSQLDNVTAKQAIDETNVGVLQNVTGITIPASIAAVATAVGTLTTEFDDCAVTTCAGPNNWQSLLGTLSQGVAFGEIIAFLEAAVKDPVGEASAFSSIASGTYNTAHGLIDDLLSL